MRHNAGQQLHSSPGGPLGGDPSLGKPAKLPKPGQSGRRGAAIPSSSGVIPSVSPTQPSQRQPSVSQRSPRATNPPTNARATVSASPQPSPVAPFQNPQRVVAFRKKFSIRAKVVVAMAVLSGVVTIGTILVVYQILSANLESEINRGGASQIQYARMLGTGYAEESLSESNLVQLLNDIRADVRNDQRPETDKRSTNAVRRAWNDLEFFSGYASLAKNVKDAYHPAGSYRTFTDIEQDFRWLMLANEWRLLLIEAEREGSQERIEELRTAMRGTLGIQGHELAGVVNRTPRRVENVPPHLSGGDGDERLKTIRSAVNRLALALVTYRKLNWNDTLEKLMGRVGGGVIYGISYGPGEFSLKPLRERFVDDPELSQKATYSISASRGTFTEVVQNISAGFEAVVYDEGTIRAGSSVIPGRQYRTEGDSGEQTVIIVSTTEIDASQQQLLVSIILISIGAIALTGTLAWLVGTGITRPIANLMKDVSRIAGGDFNHRPGITSSDEVGLLAKLTGEMAGSLRVGKELWHETQERRHDMGMAREIQENLLPSEVPEIPGYDIAAYYSPSKEVGGDYYDFFRADDQHLGFAIADVSGKGLPGSMVMMMAKALMTQQSEQTLSPRELFMNVNHVLAPNIKRGMFVTAYYAMLNRGMRTLTVASAGHNPMLVYRSATDEILSVNPGGIALGFDRQGTLFARNIKEEEIQLQSGDRVLLYTDGLIEATNRTGDEFGEDRLKQVVRACRTIPSNDFMIRLLQEVEAFKNQDVQHDDVTIVTILVE